MTDPHQLASLEGQQYLVLRPAEGIAAFYNGEQASIRQQLPNGITGPNAGHVTLRGFSEPTRVQELKSCILKWAARQEPIELVVEGIDGFPPPFQILIARLQPSGSLVDAYSTLTATLDATDFRRIGELPLQEWVFHLSLAYCRSLSEDEWQAVQSRYTRSVEERPREVLSQAEFVWYQDGKEHAEVVPFGNHGRAAASQTAARPDMDGHAR